MAKELKWNETHKKKSKETWQEKLKRNTGQSIDGNNFLIPEKDVKKALGPNWEEVFFYYKKHGVKVINIIAITAKSTRKTKTIKFWGHHLLAKHHWLNETDLRRTKELSSDKLIREHLEAVNMWRNEYNVPWLSEILQKASNKMYFVRDKKRKDNQEISFTSFDSIGNESGFTLPNIFHWEELIDPDTKGKVPNKDAFLYVYELINSKNKENFLSLGKDPYEIGATNFFSMNRWDENHPLIDFAEEHLPWENVKKWMLEDLVNNNFFIHYVDKANKGWSDLDNTLIVYATKFSNHLLTKNKDWVNDILNKIERGSQRDLGIILGDIFEGDFSKDFTYTFKEEDIQFHKELPNTPIEMHIGVDIDKNEEVPMTIKTLHRFEDGRTILKYGKPVYAVITHKLKANTANKKTWNAEIYYNLLKQQFLEWFKNNKSESKNIIVHMDNDQRTWIDRFNYDLAQDGIIFVNAKKHGYYGINERVNYGEEAIPLGYESFLDNIENRLFVREMIKIKNNPNTGYRDERRGKNKLNKTNSWEYCSYVFMNFKSTFPEGFWKWYYEEENKNKLLIKNKL